MEAKFRFDAPKIEEDRAEIESAIKILFGPFNVGLLWLDDYTISVYYEANVIFATH